METLFDYAAPSSTAVANPNIEELLHQRQAESYGRRVEESGSIGPTPAVDDEFLMNTVMGAAGGVGSVKSLSELFKLAAKYPQGIPAYLRQPAKAVAPKGFRKVGITRGTAPKDDILARALNRFDKHGEKIPPARQLDFKLDK
tara:strand:- start:1250 stop:1678 length:429 start_codon:yes stop_codon:yes gene_type:complete